MAAAVWPHGFSGAVSSQGSLSHASSSVAPQRPLVSYVRRPLSPNTPVVGVSTSSSLVTPGGEVVVDIPLQVPPPPLFLHTDASLSG